MLALQNEYKKLRDNKNERFWFRKNDSANCTVIGMEVWIDGITKAQWRWWLENHMNVVNKEQSVAKGTRLADEEGYVCIHWHFKIPLVSDRSFFMVYFNDLRDGHNIDDYTTVASGV